MDNSTVRAKLIADLIEDFIKQQKGETIKPGTIKELHLKLHGLSLSDLVLLSEQALRAPYRPAPDDN